MGKYLKEFNTHSEYESYIGGGVYEHVVFDEVFISANGIYRITTNLSESEIYGWGTYNRSVQQPSFEQVLATFVLPSTISYRKISNTEIEFTINEGPTDAHLDYSQYLILPFAEQYQVADFSLEGDILVGTKELVYEHEGGMPIPTEGGHPRGSDVSDFFNSFGNNLISLNDDFIITYPTSEPSSMLVYYSNDDGNGDPEASDSDFIYTELWSVIRKFSAQNCGYIFLGVNENNVTVPTRCERVVYNYSGDDKRPNVSLCNDSGHIHYNPKTSLPPIANNEIRYKTVNGTRYEFEEEEVWQNYPNRIISNTYENGIGSVRFENSITYIPTGAFSLSAQILSSSLSYPHTGLEGKVRDECCLTYLELPNSVTTIQTFSLGGYCTGIVLPDSITSIGENGINHAFTVAMGCNIYTTSQDVCDLFESVKLTNYRINANAIFLNGEFQFYVRSILPGCLLAGTKILMADGTVKNVEDIKVGERVISVDAKTMEKIEREVVYADGDKIQYAEDYNITTFEDGTVLKTCLKHEFYNKEAGKWAPFDDWKIGDHAIKEDGTYIAMVSNEKIQETVQHYAIVLEDSKNGTSCYYADGILSGDWYCNNVGYKFE